MTQTQVKEQLNAVIDTLSPDQAKVLLDFAGLLGQRLAPAEKQLQSQEVDNERAWEEALAIAEGYWFQLPEATRTQYTGRVVALLYDQILDADVELKVLRRRVAAQYPNQPVLYLDADAKQEPPLFVLSPNLRSN